MLPLKIFTFGGLSIQRGDQPVRGFVSRKVEALLVYLAFERREHPRELLATLLWEDLSQTRAMANLRMALSNLQSELPHYLIATRQTLMINPDSPCWLDAAELTQTLKLSSGKLTGAITRQLDAALALYKGDFLAGFHLRDSPAYEGWMILEADRLRGLVIEALKRMSESSLDHGDYLVGIDQARRVLALDPLAEESHRTLMKLLARSGQRTAGLAQYETCVRLLREELDVAPEPETTRLYSQLQAEHKTGIYTADKATVRLPIPATPFIERPTELRQIAERLDDPTCRLLTIVGPGGIGKTRLALQAAAEHAHEYRDGVYFIPLVSVQSGNFLPVEIASVLHLSLQGIAHPIEELIGYLADREILLVLDNFEHLVTSANLLSDILSRSPGVRILVTSREWLNIQQEWVLPIGGMDFPTTVSEDADSYAAVQLFVACARRVRPRFSLADELPDVVTICQLVEGMPLSIELAAAWLRVIPASEIAQQVGVKFLSTMARDVPERHRSVDAVFDYSWRQLSADEMRVMMKLSVFKGPFDRAGASQVAGASVRILASLIEKSLIRLVNETTYDIHELLRQFAFNRLTDAGEATATQDAHLNYYAKTISDPASRLHGQQQTVWLDRLEQEHDNLRTALSWSLTQDEEVTREAGLILAASIWEFWLMRGHISEGRQWLEQLLTVTKGSTSLARGAATQGAGYLAWIQGELDRAEALHQEGVAIRGAIDDKTGMGGSLNNLGLIAWSRGNFRAARDYYEQALSLQRESDDKLGTASVLANFSLLLQDTGEYPDALAYSQEAWALFKDMDDLPGMTYVLTNLGTMTFSRGDWQRARTIEEEALEVARQLGDQRVIGAVLQNLGQTLIALGAYDDALACLDESLPLVTQVGAKLQVGLVKKTMALLALCEGHLDDAQAFLNESLRLFRTLKAEVLFGQTLLIQGDIQQARMDLSQAESTYGEALNILYAAGNQQPFAEALYRVGGLAVQQGDILRAVTLISAADTLARQLDANFPAALEGIDRSVLQATLSPEDYDQVTKLGSEADFETIAERIGLRTLGKTYPTNN